MASRLGSGRKRSSEAKARRLRERYSELEAFDRQYVERGYRVVAGVDEVGRGALAGPVASAAVILPAGCGLDRVFDSKKLTPDEREEVFSQIVPRALSVRVAFGSPALIDRENILCATLISMHRALDGLCVRPDLVLVDGREVPQWPGTVVAIEKGDSKSLSIAAASIVAKVARDRLMQRLHRQFPRYGFDENKGYGTPEHVEALQRFGPAPVHRRTFLAKVVEKNLSMF